MADVPLPPEKRRAAAMLGAGRRQQDVADEVGVVRKTIGRWLEDGDFRRLVRRHREELIADVPTAESVLVQALGATTRVGSPDWTVRIQAAKAILGAPVASAEAEEKARETRIYLPPPDGEPDDGSPRPFPADPEGNRARGEAEEQRRIAEETERAAAD